MTSCRVRHTYRPWLQNQGQSADSHQQESRTQPNGLRLLDGASRSWGNAVSPRREGTENLMRFSLQTHSRHQNLFVGGGWGEMGRLTALSGREKTERTLKGLHPSREKQRPQPAVRTESQAPSPTTFYFVVSIHLLPLSLQFPAFAMEMNNTVLSRKGRGQSAPSMEASTRDITDR